MDFPHTPTTPLQIYQAVTSEVNSLWYYIQQRDIPGMKPEIQWKKQCYGAWCTVHWFPTSYCHCKDKDCTDGKYILKESTIIVKNDSTLEALKRFMLAEKSWIDNFSRD